MKHNKRISPSQVGRKLRAQFGAGILVVVPIIIAILILVWLFNYIDNIAQPVAQSLLGRTIPGLGFGIMVLLIYLTGLVATSLIGKRLIRYGESLLARVPMFRYVYTGIKQIMEAFATPREGGFLQVVLVEFPKQGMRAIGFVTNESRIESGEKLLNVFIPTSPNPTSGYLEIVRESDVIRTNISVDDALKMVLSGGKVSIQEVTDKLGAQS
ncbi:MAG: hypothetical protein A2Z77_03250 [Chloroflexi bacterium RBG_13_51_36]|nr:MAG: hypothetical protein A2Z77_03250 [Chloroflexi bacterium RBG_13_51_36]